MENADGTPSAPPNLQNQQSSSVVASKEDPFSISPTRWQVVLIRALKAGDVEGFAKEARLHPEAIHEAFTKVGGWSPLAQTRAPSTAELKASNPSSFRVYVCRVHTPQEMYQWELEWESHKWYVVPRFSLSPLPGPDDLTPSPLPSSTVQV